MKKLFSILICTLLAVFLLSSCIKNNDVVWSKAEVEFDLAAYTTKSGGLPYPLVNRLPTGFGRPLSTTLDPLTSRFNVSPNDTVLMRINLVGALRSAPLTVTIKVANNFSTGIAGTHFTLVDQQVTIPANSSFGIARWAIRNPGAPIVATTSVSAVFELVGTADVPASENFKYLGWLISQ
jgi:hypothetical protein